MIQGALRNPYLVIVGALLLLVIGVTSYRQIPADLLPIFKTPAMQIVTLYPGMPPETMERDITNRMQRWTGQSIGISHQESKSMLGVSRPTARTRRFSTSHRAPSGCRPGKWSFGTAASPRSAVSS
jgi:multidrug efflux pump subunit AcrB